MFLVKAIAPEVAHFFDDVCALLAFRSTDEFHDVVEVDDDLFAIACGIQHDLTAMVFNQATDAFSSSGLNSLAIVAIILVGAKAS